MVQTNVTFSVTFNSQMLRKVPAMCQMFVLKIKQMTGNYILNGMFHKIIVN